MKLSRNIPLVKAGDQPSASHQNRLIQQVIANSAAVNTSAAAPNLGRVILRCQNISGEDYEIGEAVAWRNVLSVTDAGEFNPREALGDLVSEAERPTWHGNVASLGIVLDDTPDDDFGRVVIGGLAVVRLSVATDGEYAFIDPDEPKHWKLSPSSGYKVIDQVNDDWAIVNLSNNQTLWRYKLNEASQATNVTDARLINLDGTEFAASIELSDPLAIGDADAMNYEGYCVQAGSEWHIAPGPC